jgi:hypothetical protein
MRVLTDRVPNPGDEILRQLGVWIRGCLDIKGSYCRTDARGLTITGCLISTTPRNRRGNITIEHTGDDLYDMTFSLVNGQVVEVHEGVYVDYMVRLMKKKAGLT